MMDCYIKNKCKKMKNGDCPGFESCGLNLLINSSYTNSNIPLIYRKDLKFIYDSTDTKELNRIVFLDDFRKNILNKIETGDGLYLFSKQCGTGKTSWACKLARELIIKKAYQKVDENVVKFINVSDYLEELKKHFNTPEGTTVIEEHLRNCDLLILDDIGVEKSSDWAIERLYSLINYRINNQKSLIITSNLTISELANKLNDRIASRIVGTCKQINLVGVDNRLTPPDFDNLNKGEKIYE